MQITSNSITNYNQYTQHSKSHTSSFDTHLKPTPASNNIEINTALYNVGDKPIFTDYFQSTGRAMKNKTSFNEDWVNPNKIGNIIEHKGIYINTVPDEEIKRDNQGRIFVDLLPESYFKNMTIEEEEKYKEIMTDTHISYGEIDSLSFEEVKNLNPLTAMNALLREGYTPDEIPLFTQDSRVRHFLVQQSLHQMIILIEQF